MNKESSLKYPFLLRCGLNESEARVYEALVAKGQAKPRDLVQATGLGRPNVYHVLEVLEQKKLATKIEGEQVLYQATNPENLKAVLEERRTDVTRLEQELDLLLPRLVSDYAVQPDRAITQIYQGYAGYKKVIDDILADKNEILIYFDPSALTGKLLELDEYFGKQRTKAGVPVRILVSHTPEAHELLDDPGALTQVRYLQDFPHAFRQVMHIQGDKITYFTMRNGQDVAIRVHESSIADMHRQMFEFLWQKTKEK